MGDGWKQILIMQTLISINSAMFYVLFNQCSLQMLMNVIAGNEELNLLRSDPPAPFVSLKGQACQGGCRD